ncbi:universal stress protein [Lysinibacillus sp. LZ02]|uniref:universal stress protein n=1 Tax=Lysinibacillus sp. LZ02 TaxID=3420668 RepID=UPI003D36C56E
MISSYKNIAVALDFSQQSIDAFERAVEIAKQNSATLHLISVVDTHSFGTVEAYDVKYAEKLKQEYEVKMGELKAKAHEAGVEHVNTKVETGKAKVILTNLPDINLMVIGATGLNRVEKLMLGSVSERIVRHANCDVLVVRNEK